MTGAEYREFRETRLRMTRVELGRILGRDESTIVKREGSAGELPEEFVLALMGVCVRAEEIKKREVEGRVRVI